jgi:glutathione S-transferase
MSAKRALSVASSWGASIARLGAGYRVGRPGRRPDQLLELWGFESCPYSRRVREALSELDLDARVYPCPKRGSRHRPEVRARGFRLVPVLRDPGRRVELDESADIVAYLFEQYGEGSVPLRLRGPAALASSLIATGLRLNRGWSASPSRPAERPLELYEFEASPYCRLVREALCELEISYISRTVAKDSAKRAAFVARAGKMMVPYLIDPNTGVEMFESAEIVDYLEVTYGLDRRPSRP